MNELNQSPVQTQLKVGLSVSRSYDRTKTR